MGEHGPKAFCHAPFHKRHIVKCNDIDHISMRTRSSESGGQTVTHVIGKGQFFNFDTENTSHDFKETPWKTMTQIRLDVDQELFYVVIQPFLYNQAQV